VTTNLVERIRSKVTVARRHVIAVERLGASMLRVRASLVGEPVTLGSHFAVAVDGSGGLASSTWRRFTVSAVGTDSANPHESWFEWIAYGAGDRPSAIWHRGIDVGRSVAIRSFDRPSPPPPPGAIWMGDETAIGSFASLVGSGVQPGRVVLHTDDARDSFVPGVDPDLAEHVGSIGRAMEAVQRATIADHLPADVYVAGGRDLVVAARAVVATTGRPGPTLLTRTYWAPGKRGMD
jgi:hypothetical protein